MEPKVNLLREYIRKLIFEVEGDKTSLAENGDCGVFAVALLRALAARGFYDASFVVIADAEDYEGDYPISFPAFFPLLILLIITSSMIPIILKI